MQTQGISKQDATISCLIWRELSENYQISAQGLGSQNLRLEENLKINLTTSLTTFSMALQKFHLEKSLTVSLFSKFLKTHSSL